MIKLPLTSPVILTLGSMLSLGTGCSTIVLLPYKGKPVASYSNTVTRNGLSVAVHPITDTAELKRVFGANLLAWRVLPVFVVAENTNPSSSFLISKDLVSLRSKITAADLQEGQSKSAGNGKMVASGKMVAVAGLGLAGLVTLPLSLPLLCAGDKIVSDTSVIADNMVSQELQVSTVSPGKSVDGFVYFTLPSGSPALKDWLLRLEATELTTQSAQEFQFDLKSSGQEPGGKTR